MQEIGNQSMKKAPYNTPILAKFDFIPEPQVVFRDKNAYNDYYVVCYWGVHLKESNLVSWTALPKSK